MTRLIMIALLVIGLTMAFLTHSPGVLGLGLVLAIVGAFGTVLSIAASRVAAKLVEAIRPAMQLPGELEIAVTASLGLAFWHGHSEGAEGLLERADQALYRAKAAGRDTFAQTVF